uniref:Uncharacterized protein n=1 Tax=Acrobeloides nanus TaxID=290746 RepID=A0A914D1L2_9BILA
MNSVQNPNFEPIFQQLSPRDQTQSQIENPSNPSQPLSSHAPTIVYNMPPVPQPNRYYGGSHLQPPSPLYTARKPSLNGSICAICACFTCCFLIFAVIIFVALAIGFNWFNSDWSGFLYNLTHGAIKLETNVLETNSTLDSKQLFKD